MGWVKLKVNGVIKARRAHPLGNMPSRFHTNLFLGFTKPCVRSSHFGLQMTKRKFIVSMSKMESVHPLHLARVD